MRTPEHHGRRGEWPTPTEVDVDTFAEGSIGRRRQASEERRRAGLQRGTALGRYLVLDKLGEGGMSVVYAAYDPELDRRIALKLLIPELTSPKQAMLRRVRVLREARAVARLSHPNVIHIHDVGTFDDHVFLALELIEGETVGRWLKRERRTWREVVRVLAAAGHGLAAAHRAGLIHRDFKPENALIGSDGRIVVTDFGLARSMSEASIADHETPGTPGYAAPEVLDGSAGDERSDQFSFGVALYYALYGKRPFCASTFDAYRAALATGRAEPPHDVRVPAWLRRVIDRALSIDPDARYPSMDDLLAALTGGPSHGRRAWSLLLLGSFVGAATVGIARLAASEEHATCGDAGERAAQTWNEARRAKLRQAFATSGAPDARASANAVIAVLDERARQWTVQRDQVCDGTRERRDDPVLVHRAACLDDQLREMSVMVDVLAVGDRLDVLHGLQATRTLSPIDDCGTNIASTSLDPATRASESTARSLLARARAHGITGRIQEAIRLTGVARDVARRAHARSLEAEILIALGMFEATLIPDRDPEPALREAAAVADASHADHLRIRALAMLVGVVGQVPARRAEAFQLADSARAAIERVGGNPRAEALLQRNLGLVYAVAQDSTRALEHYRAGLALLEHRTADEDQLEVAKTRNNIGAVLGARGRLADAAVEFESAVATQQRLLGERHPYVPMMRGNLAQLHLQLDHPEEALRQAKATLAISDLSPDHPTMLTVAGVHANALAVVGRIDEAAAAFDDLLHRTFPRSDELVTLLGNRIDLIHARRSDAAAAEVDANRAVEIARGLSDPPTLAVALSSRCRARAMARRYDLVEHDAREALALPISTDPQLTAGLELHLSQSHATRGNHKEALAAAERALTMANRPYVARRWVAAAQFAVARLLPPADRTRAIALAMAARFYMARFPASPNNRDIVAWLQTVAVR